MTDVTKLRSRTWCCIALICLTVAGQHGPRLKRKSNLIRRLSFLKRAESVSSLTSSLALSCKQCFHSVRLAGRLPRAELTSDDRRTVSTLLIYSFSLLQSGFLHRSPPRSRGRTRCKKRPATSVAADTLDQGSYTRPVDPKPLVPLAVSFLRRIAVSLKQRSILRTGNS